MKKLAGVIKSFAAFTLIMSIAVTFILNTDKSFEMIIGMIAITFYVGFYSFYLIKTSIWNFKDKLYSLQPIALIGLTLHFLSIFLLLLYSQNLFPAPIASLNLFYTTIPFFIIGILVGIYDSVLFYHGWKQNRLQKATVGKTNLTEKSFIDNSFESLTEINPTISHANRKIIMSVTTKIDFKDYARLMFILSYRKGWTIYITIIGIIMVVGTFLYYSKQLVQFNDSMVIFRFLFGLFIVILIPYSVYRAAKANYKSNKRLQERITYEFTNEGMQTIGESFNSQSNWIQTFKIEEIKSWFLIYQSKQIANFIPKKDLSDEQVESLRNLFRGITSTTVKLLNNKTS